MNNEDFVSYEIAQALKKDGFDLTCDRYWYQKFANSDNMALGQASADDFNNDGWDVPHCSAPTLEQAQKWLISKGVFVEVSCFGSHKLNHDRLSCKEVVDWSYELVNITSGDYIGENLDLFEDYSTCLSAGIEAALKLIDGK